MINVYNDADFFASYQEKRRALRLFFLITGIYLALGITILVYLTTLPYGDPNSGWPKAIVYVATVLYFTFIYPYMAIKYKRINRYHKVLSFINDGIKSEENNYFYAFRETTQQQDNVDVIIGVFGAWNKKHQEWQEREVYFDKEKPLPDFKNGDLIRYITQSNFIVQYEIVERGAYQFEELDESGDVEEVEEETQLNTNGEIDE
jgi:hypothetical protein